MPRGRNGRSDGPQNEWETKFTLLRFHLHAIKNGLSVRPMHFLNCLCQSVKTNLIVYSRKSLFLNKTILVRPTLNTIPSLITIFFKVLLTLAKAGGKVYYRKKYKCFFKTGGYYAPDKKNNMLCVWCFLVLFTLFGFFLLPPVLKMILVKKLSENLHRQVTIQKIKINPYALTVDVKGFLVKERGSAENFVSFDEIFVNLSSLSLAKRAVILEEARIIKPYFKVVRKKDESYNFSDLLGKPKSEPEKKTEPIRFSLNNISLSGGSIDFIDGPKDITHTVRNLNITIPSISNQPYDIDIFVQPKLSAAINGENFFLQGKTKPFADSLQTNVDITLKDIALAHYLPYVPMKLNFKLPSGALDVNAKFAFIRYKDKGPALELTGIINLRDLGLDDLENKPLLRLSSVSVDLGSLKPFSKNFHIAKVILQSPELAVRRSKAGKINFQSLVGQEAQMPAKNEATSVPSPPKDSGLPLVVVDQLQIQQGKLSFYDDMPAEPVTLNLSNLMFQGDNLSTAKESKGMLSLSLAVEKQGSLSVKGPVSIDPLNAELAVETKDITLDTFQPYFTDKVKINITNGSLSTTGNLGVIDSGQGRSKDQLHGQNPGSKLCFRG